MVDMETVMSGICDEFPHLRKYRFIILNMVAAVFFLLGLPQVTQVLNFLLRSNPVGTLKFRPEKKPPLSRPRNCILSSKPPV